MPAGRHAAVISFIVLLHIGFFYAMQSGLLRQASRLLDHEVIARLILPDEPPPPPPPPPPPQPKVVAPPPPPPPPTATIKPVDTPPPPTAITLPPAPPEPPKVPPAPEPVVVAPAPPAPPPPVAAPPAPPPPPPAEPKVRSIGDAGIEYVRAPTANYPPISLRLKETGDLLVRVLVDEHGKVQKVEIQKGSGFARLDSAAREAALRAQFKPYMESGRAVTVWVVVPFSFKLDS